MSTWKNTAVMALALMLCLPAAAQDNDAELDQKIREAERRLIENEARMAEAARDREVRMAERERERAEALREVERVRSELELMMQDENIEIEVRMRAAEASLTEAAQHVAQLSRRQLPQVARIERIIRAGHGPVLGVSIGSDSSRNPVEGVTIRGVSPGGAAEEAGLRAGDIITSINGDAMLAENDDQANEILLDFMQGVQEGDELAIEYLRNGKTAQTELAPRSMQSGVIAFDFDGADFTAPGFPRVPKVGDFNNFIWISDSNGLGDMEIVPLTKRLGSYFGTDEGLLIVRAPKNEQLKLLDGDVIQSIDGRKPTSVNHAMRILGSYQSGETVKFEIMRDKRLQTISVEVPENLRGHAAPVVVPVPVAAPRPAVAPRPAAAPRAAAVPEVVEPVRVKIIARPAERI